MKKLLIVLLIGVPSLFAERASDRFVQAIEQIAAPTSLLDDIFEAIEAVDKVNVTTNLRLLDCSEKSQEEKVTILTKLYAVAVDVYDKAEMAFAGKWVKWARRWSKASLADAKYIEELILQKLDAERMPQSDVKEDMNAVYAAIAAVDFEGVKEAIRVLDHKGLYGKPLEYALKGFEKASAQLVEDLEENLKLPRNAEDKAALKRGAGLTVGGFVGGVAAVYALGGLTGMRMMKVERLVKEKGTSASIQQEGPQKFLKKYSLISALVGGAVTLTGLYYLTKGALRGNQRTQLTQAKKVYEHIRMRLDKVVPPTSVERQSGMINQDVLKDAIKVSDFDKVQSVVWDLECSYLEPEAKQELINWAASYAAEVLNKCEEDLAYTGSWKKLKLDSLKRRSWKDTAKVAVGGAGAALFGLNIIGRILTKERNRGDSLFGNDYAYSMSALSAAIAGYIARDGWKRTTQIKQLNNAKEIKQLLRGKAN